MSHRLLPFTVLVSVTGLLVPFGSTAWAWLGGPVASLAIWMLDRRSHTAAEPAPARRAISREPAAVD